MTTMTMADAREQGAEVWHLVLTGAAGLLFGAGWLAVKVLRIAGTVVVGLLFGIGWCARKAGPWCLAALREGWDAGRPPAQPLRRVR